MPIDESWVGSLLAGRKSVFVTDLQSLGPSTDRQFFSCSAYSVDGDGGGGHFVWNPNDSRADDGGTVIASAVESVGRWNRVYTNVVNVRWFGAKGDNTHDDTAAIKAAVACAIKIGGSVYFPGGTYLTTSTTTIATACTVLGDAHHTTSINCTASVLALDLQAVVHVKNLNVQSNGGGIRLNAHNVDLYSSQIGGANTFENVSVSRVGASSIGIEFLTDNGHYIYFPHFHNVSVAMSGAALQGATAVKQTGTSGQVIGGRWFGGRIAGVGTGFHTGTATEWSVVGLAFDTIVNDGATVNVSGVNVGTGVITTSTNHGLSPGQLVVLANVGGVTSCNGVRQVATTPLATTFTLYNVTLGGSYTSGGTVAPANGKCVYCPSGAQGNCFRSLRIEYSAVEIIAQCDSGSYANSIELAGDVPALPAQMTDGAGSNNLTGVDGTNGFVDTIGRTTAISGVTCSGGRISPLAADHAQIGTGTVANAGEIRLPNGGAINQTPYGGSGAYNLISGLGGGFNRTLIGDANNDLAQVQAPRLTVQGFDQYGKMGVGVAIVATGSYTCDSGSYPDHVVLLDGPTTAVTLPSPSAYGGGSKTQRMLTFKDITGSASSNHCTISHHASEVIDGASTYVITTNYGWVTLVSDGTNWWVIAKG